MRPLRPIVRLMFGGGISVWLAQAIALANDLSVRRWTSGDGLPQNRISALAQTSEGYLWCGTWFGLARFDGVRFTVFDRETVPAFHHNAVNALVVDRVDGALWVATRDGLLRLHGGHWRRFSVEDGLPAKIIWRLLPRQTGGVWLDTDWQVAVVTADGPQWVSPQLVEAGSLPAGDTIRQLVTEMEDRLIFVTDSGLKQMRLGVGGVETLHARGATDAPWRTALLDSDGNPELVGTSTGLARLRKSGGALQAESMPLASGETVLLHRDALKRIWGAPIDRGLGWLRDDIWGQFELLSGKRSTDLTSALNDQEGATWLGTSDGLFRVQAAAAATLTKHDGLPDDDVWAVHESEDTTLWVGTGRGAVQLRDGKFIMRTGADFPFQVPCRSVWSGQPGATWFGFDGHGLGHFAQGHFQSVVSSAELGDAEVNCLYGDHDGRLWIGNRRGAFVWADGKLRSWALNLQGSADTPAVKTVAQDRLGRLWFGTDRHGLLGWHQGKLRQFTRRDGLAGDAVWAIHEDATGTLWLAGDRGLTRFSPPAEANAGAPTDGAAQPFAFAYGPERGLPAEEINQVLEDDFGHLWLGTLRGVLRVDRGALEAVATGKADRVAVVSFGTSDGMESSETNGEHQPAGCKTRDGRIWFPTTRGVSVFDPKQLLREEAPPTVVIEESTADGVTIANGVKLPSGKARLIQFRHTAPTFVNASRARFRHRLHGHDDGWHEAGEERVAYFTNLKPGNYSFEVEACNAHGVWATTPARFTFSLAPSFTQTAWFPSSLAAGGAALAGGFVAWRLRWQRRSAHAERTAALADERARIARDLHDELGTALTGIALNLDVLRQSSATAEADQLGEAAGRTRALAERMREVVWAVNPHCDTVPSLALFLEQQAVPFLRSAGITCRLDYPEELPRLPLNAPLRHQLALGVREALTNVVRHSGADEVRLRLELGAGRLTVEVADNGRGFLPPAADNSSHGLANLQERFARLGGSFTFTSSPNEGTRLLFIVPMATPTSFKAS